MDYSDDMGGMQLHNVVLFTRIATTKSTRSATEHRLVQKAQKYEEGSEKEDGNHTEGWYINKCEMRRAGRGPFPR